MLAGLMDMDRVATATPPLDGLAPNAAWSLSRDLLSSFVGGVRYTTLTGVINVLNDQSGNSLNLSQLSASQRPAPIAAGPRSRICADFDGLDDGLGISSALSNFISSSAGYIIATVIIDSFPTNQVLSYNNSIIFLDLGKLAGLTLRLGNIFYAYNWDGNEDKAQGTVNVSTAYVVEWRHDGGNIYQRVNGVGETSVASGNTTDVTNFVAVGLIGGAQAFDGKLFEMATWSTVPSLAQRDALVQSLGTWIGASV